MNFHAFRLLFPLLFWQLSVVIFAIFTRWALGVEPPAFALNPNLKPYPLLSVCSFLADFAIDASLVAGRRRGNCNLIKLLGCSDSQATAHPVRLPLEKPHSTTLPCNFRVAVQIIWLSSNLPPLKCIIKSRLRRSWPLNPCWNRLE